MSRAESRPRWLPALVGFQALYYVLVGLWPVIHLRSFEVVTGPKVDDWLVLMVGLLAAAIGATLAVGVRRGTPGTPEMFVLSVASALAFAAIDLRFALAGRISSIYLLDAILELALVGLRIVAARSR